MATETATAEATKTDETQGTTILTAKEPEKAAPETQLFKSEAEKSNAVAEAKANAIKELETKSAADKATADAAAKVEADKKAAEEKTKTDEKATQPPKKDATSQTEYTLTLPENSPLTKEDLDGFLKEAKESGLTEEQAKKSLQKTDQVARTAQGQLVEKQKQDMKVMVTGWKEAVKNDPEIGGEKLAETAIKASRAFRAVATPAMQKFCEETGYADHPEMVKMMLKVYELIGEDRFVRGSTGMKPPASMTMEDKAKKLFGNPIKEAAV